MDIPHKAMIVIADGEKALFLRNDGDAKYPNLTVVKDIEHDNPPNREQKANLAGRMSDGPQGHYSKVEDTDWHQLEKERFASDLADRLYKRSHNTNAGDLIVVAAPQILGHIRPELHQTVEARIIAEIDKDLTNHPMKDIEKVLKAA